MIYKKNPLKDVSNILDLFKQMKFGQARKLMRQLSEDDLRKAKESFDRELDKNSPQ